MDYLKVGDDKYNDPLWDITQKANEACRAKFPGQKYLTVGALKALLEHFPDNMLLGHQEEPGTDHASLIEMADPAYPPAGLDSGMLCNKPDTCRGHWSCDDGEKVWLLQIAYETYSGLLDQDWSS